jgi:hypothetical protein
LLLLCPKFKNAKEKIAINITGFAYVPIFTGSVFNGYGGYNQRNWPRFIKSLQKI